MLMDPNFNSSHHQQEEESTSDLQLQFHHAPQQCFNATANAVAASPPNSIHMRQLLIRCAQFISQSDFVAARRLLSILSSNSSPYGDSTERLVHQFSKALFRRCKPSVAVASAAALTLPAPTAAADIGSASKVLMTTMNSGFNYGVIDENAEIRVEIEEIEEEEEGEAIQSCYLSLNQITPFIRFSHLTANQAILEAIDEGQQAIHVLDFDIMHGVQWPPLMQALAERSAYIQRRTDEFTPLKKFSGLVPPMLRITATGRDLTFLHKTGDRLSKFAQSLGLRFQFHPLLLLNDHDHHRLIPSALNILPGEALAVNCVLYLHKLLKDDLHLLLHKIKALNPKVVTIAEKEANHSHPLFMQRFLEALNHYSLIFDSLEATLPPNSRERLAVEQIWFGREINDVVSAEGNKRRQRHERYESWEVMLRSLGFSNIPFSPFALSQAKLLLRLHYPSEGYHLQILNDSLFLGWQNRSLFSVSSWH